jgi:hypothetical protein
MEFFLNRQHWLRGWPLVLIFLIGLVLWAEKRGFWKATATVENVQVACAKLSSGCSVQLGAKEIRFGIDGELKPLVPFKVWVSGVPATSKAEARFTMEGMDMGFNLYTLRPDAQNVLRATVTLPICVTGRRDWNMILHLDNLHLSVPFVTNL